MSQSKRDRILLSRRRPTPRRRAYRDARLVRPFSEAYKELLIAIGPSNRGRNDPNNGVARSRHKFVDLVFRFLVQFRIVHDTTASDIGALQFKLRLNQGENHSVWS